MAKKKKLAESKTSENLADSQPLKETEEYPATSLLSNREALAALETERDEIMLRIQLSLNSEAFNAILVNAIETDPSAKSFTKNYDGITVELTLPGYDFIQRSELFIASPYQISQVKIDPDLKQLSADELSNHILNAFQKAEIDGFLAWVKFYAVIQLVWRNRCQKTAHKLLKKSNRVQFDHIRQGSKSLEDSEEALSRILKTVDTHASILYENFTEVWGQRLSRFIREHPQLIVQKGKVNLQKLIQALDASMQKRESCREPDHPNKS
ncbi:hypothetical protein ACQ4M3_13325 [Leptolyngbya sp. AN03gr2]|uniref:hypothetical protein n=1 Tax=unclassified Leptolyngbya TaxID=2650499 RepID=UPI003D31B1F8